MQPSKPKGYAQLLLKVPSYIFLGGMAKKSYFGNGKREAFPHPVKTFFNQADLERRFADLPG